MRKPKPFKLVPKPTFKPNAHFNHQYFKKRMRDISNKVYRGGGLAKGR